MKYPSGRFDFVVENRTTEFEIFHERNIIYSYIRINVYLYRVCVCVYTYFCIRLK